MASARSTLTSKPAAQVAAAKAERLEVLAAIEAQLEAAHGPSWRVAGNAAQALASPDILRVLLGVPHPGPGESAECVRARFVANEISAQQLGKALGLHVDGVSFEWATLLTSVSELRAIAEAVEPVSIDDTTPEGVLALLDAAIRALEADGQPSNARAIQQTRDDIADWNGLPLRNEDAFIASKVEAVAAAFDARRTDPIAAQSASLARLDGAVLLARFRRLAAGTDEIIANPSDSGWSERQHLTMLAAVCLALVAKLTADTTGGAF
jgi:hypothetical protein